MASKLSLAMAVAVVAVGALALGTPARAQQSGVKVGVLTCNVSSGWGFIFGSSRDLRCTYSPRPGVTEHYAGQIQKFGVDIGYLSNAVMVWSVIALEELGLARSSCAEGRATRRAQWAGDLVRASARLHSL